jgi:multidrug efflux pump subunit AcrA (membrane-fusion protein)
MTTPPTIADLADDIREGLRSGIFDGGSERRDRDDAHAALDILRARAEAAEAALVLACPHCGPEHFAGPDADGACVMCMGALIRTDAAGAVLAHELYNGAHVAEAALATARAEGAAAERAAIVAALRGFAAAEDLVADEAEASENMGRGRINGGAIVRRGAAALRAAAGVIEGRRPVEGV